MPIKETVSHEEIERIKNSIVRSENLLKGGVPIQLDESTVTETNCYAYSMGIMYNSFTKIKGYYNPGFTEYERLSGDETSEILMEKIRTDLNHLGIQFREIGLEKKIELEGNEYLVKVFKADINEKLPRGDFHFIRQDRESKKWFHKMGWQRQPDIIQSDPGFDDESIPGVEPDTFTINCDNGFTYMYYSVGYLAIKED